MDPVIGGMIASAIAVGAYAGDKSISYVEDKFAELVIKRWTRHRAEAFFKSFIDEVELSLNGMGSNRVHDYLDAMLNDSEKSELLFDAYRRVSFSTAKTLGPRIIGLLTARLLLKNGKAGWAEDKVFTAAESLSDPELLEFAGEFRDCEPKLQAMKGGREGYCYNKEGYSFAADGGDGAYQNSEFVSHSSDLEEWGSWATKLRNHGIIEQRTIHRQENFRDTRSVPEEYVAVEFSYWLVFSSAGRLLAEYIEEVSAKRGDVDSDEVAT